MRKMCPWLNSRLSSVFIQSPLPCVFLYPCKGKSFVVNTHFLRFALWLQSVNHLVGLSVVSPSLTETIVQSLSQQCESSTSFSLPSYNGLKACSTDRTMRQKYVALRCTALCNRDSVTVTRLLYFILPPTLFSVQSQIFRASLTTETLTPFSAYILTDTSTPHLVHFNSNVIFIQCLHFNSLQYTPTFQNLNFSNLNLHVKLILEFQV